MSQRGKRFIVYSFVMWMWLFGMSLPTLAASQATPLTILSLSTDTPQTIEQILLSSVGDCTLGTDERFGSADTMPAVIKAHGNDYSYVFSNVAEIFAASDFTTANLETTLTRSNHPVEKTFAFHGDPEYANMLKLGHINAVNLSNNHIYDYGDVGFSDTLASLNKTGITYFGEGNVAIQTIKGRQFAFLGYTGFSYDRAFLEKLRRDIETVKKQGCIVIINFHWGEELLNHTIPTQKELAHYAIDYGADFIFGHHPHVLQPIERYKGKLICYSLGNFAFGGNKNPDDKDTMIVQTRFDFQGSKLVSYGVRIIPCSISSVNYINDYRPTPLTGNAKARVLDRLNKISPLAGFTLTDEFTTLPFEETAP
ncbi:MAG: CapA family protein [Sporomusaceae bacterium]|nr:CapA family protein [Sporomusaceae bacterium]